MHRANLRVVSMNTWADSTGKFVGDVVRLKERTDVLCFQEVHRAPEYVPSHIWPSEPGKRIGPINTSLYGQIATVLADQFDGYYSAQMRGALHDMEASVYSEFEYGNALFVRKGIKHKYRDGFIYGSLGKMFDEAEGTPAGKTGQAIDIYDEQGIITVAHAHGAWYKSDKTSNFPWRNEQVDGIIRLIAPHHEHLDELAKYDTYSPRVIFLGDLNVLTSSHTIKGIAGSKVFGRVGGCHLNTRYGVWCTRTDLYTGEFLEAGHAFASYNLNAKLSTDLNVESDHAALIIETGMGNNVL